MVSRTIKSLQHPFVKYCVRLRTNKTFREQEGKVVIFGSTLISELCSFAKITTLLETYPHVTAAKADERYIISEEIIKKISGMPAPEPVAAIIEMPEEKDLSLCSRLLILDRISDPGNLGTLLRTALALGWDGVFLIDGCCDPFNDKALRAAKGSTFLLPLQSGSLERLNQLLQKKPRHLYVADLNGSPFTTTAFKLPLALALGCESSGPSTEIKNRFEKISIPMKGPMESLNVAIAGGILLSHIAGAQ